MTHHQANEPVGYFNVKYGTFFRPAGLAATERTKELIDTGEIIAVYRAPAPASEPAAGRYVAERTKLAEIRAVVERDRTELNALMAKYEVVPVAQEVAAVPPQVASEHDRVMEALTEARSMAMRNSIDARIPECGNFAEIAQNLDWAITTMLAAPPSPSVDQAKRSILVRITAKDEGYEDVHPDLMMEDAMRVNPYGWPQGFSFEVVDQAKRLMGGEVAAPVKRQLDCRKLGGLCACDFGGCNVGLDGLGIAYSNRATTGSATATEKDAE